MRKDSTKSTKSSDVQCNCCDKWVNRDNAFPYESETKWPNVTSGRVWVCEMCMPKG